MDWLGRGLPAAGELRKENTMLEGTWALTAYAGEDKSIEGFLSFLRCSITADTFTIATWDGTPVKDAEGAPVQRRYTLDPTQSPAAIDLLSLKQERSLGIWELNGDQLRICIAAPGGARPTEFRAQPGLSLLVLKRTAPGK